MENRLYNEIDIVKSLQTTAGVYGKRIWFIKNLKNIKKNQMNCSNLLYSKQNHNIRAFCSRPYKAGGKGTYSKEILGTHHQIKMWEYWIFSGFC